MAHSWECEENNYTAVVAIDFGTTFSGFAFSFKQQEEEAGIYLNKEWGNEHGYYTLKTPTCLLLRPDLSFDRFGFEAQTKYANLEDAQEQKSFYYFERFKMLLHRDTNLNRETKIQASNGKSIPALYVFALSVEFLKDKALEVIKERTSVDYGVKDIQWILTVPAIWEPPAKQFMREAAYKAGLASDDNPEQLVIARESEAAAIYCRQRKMREFVSEKGNARVKDAIAYAKTQYVMVDIGGGTLDVTAHEILENEDIRELQSASGGDHGGIKVDMEFEKLMDKFFGEDLMHNFKKDHPSDWLEITRDFEVKKRANRVAEGEDTRVRMADNFLHYNEHAKKDLEKKTRGRFAMFRWDKPHYNEKDVRLTKGFLSLSPAVMKDLFKPAVTSIIKHLKGALKDKALVNVKYFFLVGGFSASCLLQQEIRKEFGKKYRVLIPEDAKVAVVKGAVMFGQRPQIISERVLPATYGTEAHAAFQEGDPPERLRIVDGERLCKDVFSLVARAGEVVKLGDFRTSERFCPLLPEQNKVSFHFYTTRRDDIPRYTDEEGVRELPGYISVESPDTHKGKDRKLELRMYFGGTEIKATGIDLSSGKTATAYIDFLNN